MFIHELLCFLLTHQVFQDAANPKLKKCKERADDKVALTEKALAKARVEKEAATKKTKIDVSVDVKSPRMGSGPAILTFHYTPRILFLLASRATLLLRRPRPKWLRPWPRRSCPSPKCLRRKKNKWVNEAMDIICNQNNQDRINETVGKNETNELYPSWLHVSFPSELSILLTFVVANFLF